MTISHVLILCRGNLCRSPMAAALLSRQLQCVTVRSAGLAAVVGEPPAPEIVTLLSLRDIDVSGHRAVQVTRSMCEEADLILVMSGAQQRTLHHLFPQVRGKVFLLSETGDVMDPFGQKAAQYDVCFAVVSKAIERWVRRIKSESPEPSDMRARLLTCQQHTVAGPAEDLSVRDQR